MKFDFLSESDQAYFIHKASTLVEALPFIREHSGDTIVIKYGGHAMGDPKLAKSFARDIGLMKEVGIFPVVVHGGGPQIAEKLKTNNITSEFVNGLRVTDAETVKVVEDVLANEINKNGFSIQNAKINTLGERVEYFYVLSPHKLATLPNLENLKTNINEQITNVSTK